MLREEIAKILYDELDYMYCENCRFDWEISETDCEEKNISWGCEDCHRKNNGWGLSKAEAERIANQIEFFIINNK